MILNGEQRPENEIDDYAAFIRRRCSNRRSSPPLRKPLDRGFHGGLRLLLDEGAGEIVSQLPSGAISGTREVARQAAVQLEADGRGGERITVVDSRTTAGGLAFGNLAAANAIKDGKDVAG